MGPQTSPSPSGAADSRSSAAPAGAGKMGGLNTRVWSVAPDPGYMPEPPPEAQSVRPAPAIENTHSETAVLFALDGALGNNTRMARSEGAMAQGGPR